jgi:tRNA modification GTPase
MRSDDTIAAVSTPPGRGGIGVIRLSGPLSLEISSAFFRSRDERATVEPNRARFGRILDPSTGEAVDEVVLTFFKAPHSYTGEDVVELSCHGSPVILRRLLDMVVAGGARLAEPGEFTFRAFFNRRIDLAQAQAVRDVIEAQTDYQARVAARQLEGALSNRLAPVKQSLIEVIVHLESAVEFIEEDISPEGSAALLSRLGDVARALSDIAESYSFGRLLKQGFDLAVVGRPNVGKSSVFNRLVGRDRAIVTEIPGTTRDTLHESASIDGVPVRLIDTAGIRETTDRVESIGIERSRTAIAEAEVSIVVLDQSEPLTPDDFRLLKLVPEDRRMIVLNKIDLVGRLDAATLPDSAREAAIPISALTAAGFDQLTSRLLARLSGAASADRDDIMITDARQHAAIKRALDEIKAAIDLIGQGELEEIILLKLRAGLEALGEVTGETLTDDILGQIFSTFCIGK